MKKTVRMQPVEMTPAVMDMLEKKGLIIRLCPGHHELPAQPGETLGQSLYESAACYGPHKLIVVTVNRTTFSSFGSHPDHEEFILLGNPDTKPLYLVIALCHQTKLDQKIAAGALSAEDFVCLRVRYNDPEVSFFTMLARVPHGEAIEESVGRAPSFYVTESRDLGIDLTNFGDYELGVIV